MTVGARSAAMSACSLCADPFGVMSRGVMSCLSALTACLVLTACSGAASSPRRVPLRWTQRAFRLEEVAWHLGDYLCNLGVVRPDGTPKLAWEVVLDGARLVSEDR